MKARRFAYCRGCSTETAQAYVGVERGPNAKTTEFWECVACQQVLISYADVTDAEGLAIHLSSAFLKKTSPSNYDDVRSLERDDVLAQARAEMWVAYLAWDPARGVRFRAFAVFRVNARLISWLRQERGFRRDGGKAGPGKLHADALSLDATTTDQDEDGQRSSLGSGLESALGQGDGDPATDRSPDLARALARRDSGVVEQERSMGIGPEEGAEG